MEKELVSQADESSPPADQQGEKIEQKKESSHHSSRRRSSPSTGHRNYRKRSVSESPEKAPERSPENSPSSRKRSRNSDYRDDRRHHRKSRSRSRSRSPRRRRRRRSPSPRNLIHMMDLGPEVNGHLTTLLWKVEKILENQERVLKNQEQLLKLVEQQQQATTGTVVCGDRLVNGVRPTTNQEHSHSGELRLRSNLLDSLAVLTNETVSDTSCASGHSSRGQKGSRALKKHAVSTKALETNDSGQNSSVSVDESVDYQNVVSLGPKYSVSVSPSITALNSGCLNCDSGSGTVEIQDETSSDSDRTRELLAWAERIQKTSCSIGNFSVNLVKVLFTKDEMSHKNCSGTRGKGALDSGKLDLVKFCAFKLYSVPEAEQESVWKQKCVVSIDEYLRRGNRSRVQKIRESKDAGTVAPLDSSIVISLSSELEDVKDDKSITEELSQT